MTIEFPQSQGSSSANILHNDWGNCEEPHVERLELVEVLSGAEEDNRCLFQKRLIICFQAIDPRDKETRP